MNIRLPLLSQILAYMTIRSMANWSRSSKEEGICSIEVNSEGDGLVSFGIFDSTDGDRITVVEGKARRNTDGTMLIDEENHAAYQMFIEGSRLFDLNLSQ